MIHLLALLLSLFTLPQAWSMDTCVDHCHLEADADDAYQVLCSCSERPYPGGGNFFALGKLKSTRFRTELTARLRGADADELETVARNACAGIEDSALCGCVRRRLDLPLEKSCSATGAGERLCRYQTRDAPGPRRVASLEDYQACIANRLNYRHDSCIGELCSHFKLAYEGGGDLKAWRVKVAPDFTEKERQMIVAGVASIPACWRKAVEGIRINKVHLRRVDETKTVRVSTRTAKGRKVTRTANLRRFACEAGRVFQKNADFIDLDPACGITVGIVVHELLHILDVRGGLGAAWYGPAAGRTSCPVTAYGFHNAHEDLAEAGRLLTYPDDDGFSERRTGGACVDEKLKRLEPMFATCNLKGDRH